MNQNFQLSKFDLRTVTTDIDTQLKNTQINLSNIVMQIANGYVSYDKSHVRTCRFRPFTNVTYQILGKG